MGQSHGIEIEVISKTREEYGSESYLETKLPVAPAIMVGQEIVVQGRDVSEEEIGKIISDRLLQGTL